MKRIVALFCKAFLFSLVAGGLSAAQQPNLAEIDSYLRVQMHARRIPGLQIAVVQHGRTALLRS